MSSGPYVCIAALAAVLFCRSSAQAIGGAAFGDELLSARSIGQGQVGVAGLSDDPSVVYLNPAAMTALPGTQITVGVTGVDLNPHYRSDSGAESDGIDTAGPVPNFAMTQRLMNDRFSVGFSAEAPYGFKSHWPDNGPLRYVATNSKFYMVDLSPAVAYQITPMISIGIAGDYFDNFNLLQERRIQNLFGAPDGDAKITATGHSWGAHGGITVTPNEHHTFAAVYHDKVKLTVNGTVDLDNLAFPISTIMGGSHYSTSGFADIYIPQNVQLAYGYRPTPRWMFEVDTAWYDWYADRDLNIRYSETDPAKLAVLNQGNPTTLDRKSSWSASVGANYHFSERWQFRGGFGYLPNATPEGAFQSSIVDLTRYGICAGTGWQISPLWTLDVAYSAIFGRSRHIGNSPVPATDGDYSNMIHLFAANITLRLPAHGHS